MAIYIIDDFPQLLAVMEYFAVMKGIGIWFRNKVSKNLLIIH